MALQPTEKEINTRSTMNGFMAKLAAIDAVARSNAAEEGDAAFFKNSAHMARVDRAREIAQKFFDVYSDVYVTHRSNRGRPFTTVKLSNVQWPSHKDKVKQAEFYQPLADMGRVELRPARQTNSYLIRVY